MSGTGYTLDGTGAQGVYVPDIVGTIDTNVGGKKLDMQGVLSGHYVAGTVTSSWLHGVGNSQVDAGIVHVAAGRPRRLTPTECERLQGFPDGHTDNGQADSHRYKQLGNAVAVPVARWIGERIMAASATDV